MMSGQNNEFAAKTVEAAVEDGLRQLGVTQEQVEIEILNQGSRGILGIGATDALVRLTLKSTSTANTASVPEEPPAPIPAPQEEAAMQEETGHQSSSDALDQDGPAPEVATETTADDTRVETGETASDDESEEPDDEFEEEDDPELADLAYDLLAQMLQHLGIRAEIQVTWLEPEDDGQRPLNLNVVGDDVSVLIGRNGETLASMQYLIRLMVNQELHRWTNVVIDVDGYKQRRAEQLSQLAHRLAAQVIDSGRAVSLEPMPASERRLIHIALRDHPDVYTESTGDDNRRKVQILPK